MGKQPRLGGAASGISLIPTAWGAHGKCQHGGGYRLTPSGRATDLRASMADGAPHQPHAHPPTDARGPSGPGCTGATTCIYPRQEVCVPLCGALCLRPPVHRGVYDSNPVAKLATKPPIHDPSMGAVHWAVSVQSLAGGGHLGVSGTPQGANRLAKIYTLLAFSRAHTPTSSHTSVCIWARAGAAGN